MGSASKSNIYFFYEVPLALRERTRLKEAIARLLKRYGRSLESLNVVFSTDDRVLDINRQFLQHDFYTDIISFELSRAREPLQGEIYISVDRVRDNARLLGQSFTRELHRVIIHGVLHFCGLKDKSKAQAAKMREAEEDFLEAYFQ